MPKVTIMAMSSVREKTGWSVKEVDCSGATLAEVLKLARTNDGGTLFDLLVDGTRMSPGYVVFVNGDPVRSPDERLGEGDKVVAIEILRMMAGGQGR